MTLLFVLCFYISTIYAQQSQKKVVVYDWKNTKENKIVISYSIPDAKSDEVYEIEVIFYDKLNAQIPAFSLFDKKNITGIKMQYVYWDFYKDRQDIPSISKIDVIVNKIDKLNNNIGYESSNNVNQKVQSYQNRTNETSAKKNADKKYKKINTSTSQMGFGYISGLGSQGGELVMRGKGELILSFMGLKPLSNIEFYNYTSLGFSGVYGFRFPRILDISLHAGYGVRIFTNKENTDESKSFNSLVLGATLPIKLSPGFGFYLKSDYWTNTEADDLFLYSVGIIWKY